MEIKSLTIRDKGSILEFEMFNTAKIADMFYIEYGDERFYFSIDSIKYRPGEVLISEVTAAEIGYRRNRIERKLKHGEIPEVLKSLPRPVLDEEVISKVRKAAMLC